MEKILEVLDFVVKFHEASGHHEINRTDLKNALTFLRTNGLLESKPLVETVEAMKALF